jgi:hypothetical protein
MRRSRHHFGYLATTNLPSEEGFLVARYPKWKLLREYGVEVAVSTE